MKRFVLLLSGLSLLFVSGCATTGYVDERVNPLETRLDALEGQVNGLAEDNAAIKQELQDIRAMTQQAMDDAARAKKAFELQQKK